ncbi:MAG: hypothetical protein RI894_502 [Bacteroidota bacterium]
MEKQSKKLRLASRKVDENNENYAQIGLVYGKTSQNLRLASGKSIKKNNENYARIGLVCRKNKAKICD